MYSYLLREIHKCNKWYTVKNFVIAGSVVIFRNKTNTCHYTLLRNRHTFIQTPKDHLIRENAFSVFCQFWFNFVVKFSYIFVCVDGFTTILFIVNQVNCECKLFDKT